MLVSKVFKFDSAHKLPFYEGKCKNLHGHTWKLIASFEGNPGKNGLILDFRTIKQIVNEKIIEKIDHVYLNDIIENPTCENILLWIKDQLSGMKGLKKLVLYETENNFCELEC